MSAIAKRRVGTEFGTTCRLRLESTFEIIGGFINFSGNPPPNCRRRVKVFFKSLLCAAGALFVSILVASLRSTPRANADADAIWICLITICFFVVPLLAGLSNLKKNLNFFVFTHGNSASHIGLAPAWLPVVEEVLRDNGLRLPECEAQMDSFGRLHKMKS